MIIHPIINLDPILSTLNMRIEKFKQFQKKQINLLLVLRKYIKTCEKEGFPCPQKNEHITIKRILTELKILRKSLI
jgi:hypothetical protein